MAENNSLLGLKIMEVLRNNSDAQHTLSQKDIIELLEKQYDTVVDRKTVNRNMEILIAYDEMNGNHICYETVERKNDCSVRKNFYYDSDFTEGEMQVLLDSVLSNRNISMKYTNELIQKITGKNNRFYKNYLKNVKFYDSYYKRDLPDLFYNAEMISEAIERKKSLILWVGIYNDKLELQEEGGQHIIPIQLFMFEQEYYLLGIHDRIRKEKLSDERLLRALRAIPVADIVKIKIRERTNSEADVMFQRIKDKIDYSMLLERSPYLGQDYFLYHETRYFRFVIPRHRLRAVVDRFGHQVHVKAVEGSVLTRSGHPGRRETELVVVSVNTPRSAMARFVRENRTCVFVLNDIGMNFSAHDAEETFFWRYAERVAEHFPELQRRIRHITRFNSIWKYTAPMERSNLSAEEKDTFRKLVVKMLDPDRERNYPVHRRMEEDNDKPVQP